MQLTITVRTLADKEFFVKVKEDDRLEVLQKMIEKQHGTLVADQELFEISGQKVNLSKGQVLPQKVVLARKLPERPSNDPPEPTPGSSKGAKKLPGVVSRCAKSSDKWRRLQEKLEKMEFPAFPPPQPRASQTTEQSPSSVIPSLSAGPTFSIRPPAAAVSNVNSSQEFLITTDASPVANGFIAPPASATENNSGTCTPQMPIGRPGPCRSAPHGPDVSVSQPCTPRTPQTPHPVHSWAPPPICSTPAPPVPNRKPKHGPTAPVCTRPTNGTSAAVNTAYGVTASVVPIPPPAANAKVEKKYLVTRGRLGVGAFGVVTLEMDRRTGRTFALKAVSKGYLAQLNMEHSVRNEKEILKMVSTPFIVRLLATYSGREHVYFLLEACLGGELFTTYEKHRLYKSEPHARFYVGCCVEALAHLHDKHVVYRDLKPENLLLDARGYCKVTDMGLAKITKQDKTFTLVGTPDYMAPEVIRCTGHNRTVDWWMLGILLFELLVGGPPFEASTTEEVYAAVQKGINVVHFPFGGDAVSLVKALCHATPECRIAADETREHLWFSNFDWHALRTCEMPPPYVPEVKSPLDLGNFRKCEEEQPPCVPYKENMALWEDFAEHGPFCPALAAEISFPVASAAVASSAPMQAFSHGASPAPGPAAAAAAAQTELLTGRALSQTNGPSQVPLWACSSSKCPTKPVLGPPLISANTCSKKVPESSTAIKSQRDIPGSPPAASGPRVGGG